MKFIATKGRTIIRDESICEQTKQTRLMNTGVYTYIYWVI